MRFKILGAIALAAGSLAFGAAPALASTAWHHPHPKTCQRDNRDHGCTRDNGNPCQDVLAWMGGRDRPWTEEETCPAPVPVLRCQVVSLFADSHGNLTTDAMLTPGEKLIPVDKFTLGPGPYTVTSFNGNQALNKVTVSPHLPAIENGQIVDFTTGLCFRA